MQPTTPISAIVPDEWSQLTHPLTIADINRLARLRLRIAAKEFLGRRQPFVEPAEAARLAFCKWLVATKRLTDEVKP